MSNAELTAAVAVHNAGLSLTKAQKDDIMAEAKVLIQAGMFPQKFKRWETAYVAALYGHEIGLSTQRAWKQIHVIQGVPAPEVHLQVAMVRQSIPGLVWKIVEHTMDICTIEHGRNPDDLQRTSFTFAEAVAAKLDGKDNWRHDRKGMLYCRAAGRAVRWFYPETQGGGLLHNNQELLDGEVPLPPVKVTTSSNVTPVAKKSQTAAGPAKPRAEIEEAQLVEDKPPTEPAKVNTVNAEAAAPATAAPKVEEDDGINKDAVLDLVGALNITDNANSADFVYGKWREKNKDDAVTLMEGFTVFNKHLKNLRERGQDIETPDINPN